MKLKNVKLKNFRGYKEEVIIPFHNITGIIGKNDAGKSTVLEALEIFFNNSLITCEREDLNINADDTNIENILYIRLFTRNSNIGYFF